MSTTAIYEQIKADLASGELKERETAILNALLYQHQFFRFCDEVAYRRTLS